MRPLVIAVLLLSCASDEARRREPRAQRVPPPRVAAAAAPAPAQPPEAVPAPATAPARPVEVAAVDPRDATRRAAHDVLAQYCGECHEGHRSKKPQALAIYDLDLPDWPARFDAHRFQTALGRLQSKPAPASQVFIAFRDAELAASAR